MSEGRLDSFIGKTIGDFKIVRKIGQGGMGLVFEAQQLSLGNRRVALKILPLIYSGDDRAHERFRREANLCARLRHPNIAQVYATGEELGLCYYAMEYIDGHTFGELVDQKKRGVNQSWRVADREDSGEFVAFADAAACGS